MGHIHGLASPEIINQSLGLSHFKSHALFGGLNSSVFLHKGVHSCAMASSDHPNWVQARIMARESPGNQIMCPSGKTVARPELGVYIYIYIYSI